MKKDQKKFPKQPTPKELQKMTLREIADLIERTRDKLWPSDPKRKTGEVKSE